MRDFETRAVRQSVNTRVSFEIVPGDPTDGFIPESHSFSLREQGIVIEAVLSALRDVNGKDRIANICGLPTPRYTVEPSYWHGARNLAIHADLNVSIRPTSILATRIPGDDHTSMLTTMDSLNLYASTIGVILRQSAVAVSYLVEPYATIHPARMTMLNIQSDIRLAATMAVAHISAGKQSMGQGRHDHAGMDAAIRQLDGRHDEMVQCDAEFTCTDGE